MNPTDARNARQSLHEERKAIRDYGRRGDEGDEHDESEAAFVRDVAEGGDGDVDAHEVDAAAKGGWCGDGGLGIALLPTAGGDAPEAKAAKAGKAGLPAP